MDGTFDYSTELLRPPKFLIIGITGPFGSGCTTLARMLEATTAKDLLAGLEEALRQLGQRIDECRRVVSGQCQLKAPDAVRAQRPPLRLPVHDPFVPIADYLGPWARKAPDGVPGACHSLLKSLLEQRRWTRALLRAASTCTAADAPAWQRFQRISMSDAIVKLCVEHSDTAPESQMAHESRWSGGSPFSGIIAELGRVRKDNHAAWKACRQMDGWLASGADAKITANPATAAAFEEYLAILAGTKAQLHERYGHEFIEFLQDCGDSLRKTGVPFSGSADVHPAVAVRWAGRIAEEANRLTKYYRHTPTARRTWWFVIECFRNRAETEHFRRRVENFFLVSLFANEEHRQARAGKALTAEQWRAMEERDQGGNARLGDLNVPECVAVADVALNNEGTEADQTKWRPLLERKLLRSLALMMEPGSSPPTAAEENMHLAQSVSLRSTCLSRQVGAVVTSASGHVLAVGWNDPPMGQIGCGHIETRLYRDKERGFGKLLHERWAEARERTRRLGVKGFRLPLPKDDEVFICFKDIASQVETTLAFGKADDIHNLCRMLQELAAQMEDADGELAGRLRQLLRDFSLVKTARDMGIRRLEYCRALHAEENALLQVARIGGISVDGGTVYTTASPCELCTKKIYQAGIRTVVYTEVYPSGISHAFREDGVRKIGFRQFEGVKSPGYHRLFQPEYPLKDVQGFREALAKGVNRDQPRPGQVPQERQRAASPAPAGPSRHRRPRPR